MNTGIDCRGTDNTTGYYKSMEAWKKISKLRNTERGKGIRQIISAAQWTDHY
jgi:hypothetical protein